MSKRKLFSFFFESMHEKYRRVSFDSYDERSKRLNYATLHSELKLNENKKQMWKSVFYLPWCGSLAHMHTVYRIYNSAGEMHKICRDVYIAYVNIIVLSSMYSKSSGERTAVKCTHTHTHNRAHTQTFDFNRMQH